jgi:DNA mismatch repair protein MSH3
MAQIGSYVPCDSAKLSLIDGVYTRFFLPLLHLTFRMGAFDNMLRGESTFMYEMNETAEIMKSATSNSLVVLDEIGRGTATFDGLAIAQAVLRYFVEDTQCLTLFVTHYPQIREIANEKPREVGTFHMGFMERQSQGCRFSSMCFDCRWIS